MLGYFNYEIGNSLGMTSNWCGVIVGNIQSRLDQVIVQTLHHWEWENDILGEECFNEIFGNNIWVICL